MIIWFLFFSSAKKSVALQHYLHLKRR